MEGFNANESSAEAVKNPVEALKECESPEQILELAKENGITLSPEDMEQQIENGLAFSATVTNEKDLARALINQQEGVGRWVANAESQAGKSGAEKALESAFKNTYRVAEMYKRFSDKYGISPEQFLAQSPAERTFGGDAGHIPESERAAEQADYERSKLG